MATSSFASLWSNREGQSQWLSFSIFLPTNENFLLLSRKNVTRKLMVILAVLLGFHLFMVFMRFGLGHLSLHGMISMFYFDDERNLPTLFSGVLILLCAVLLWHVAQFEVRRQGSLSFYWKALFAVTLFLFFDKVFSIHEIANHNRFKDIWPEGDGYSYYAWVVPYFFLATAVLMFFLKFLLKLPPKSRTKFLIAGGMYAGGAFGLESVGGKYQHAFGSDLNYALIISVEE
ncbi:hypothetical protein ACX0G7_16810 [Flavitalea antarctica]